MALETAPAFVGGLPGGTELVVILLIAVLLFGANKIPKLARSTGEAMGEFQKGREEVEQELEEMREGPDSDGSTATDADLAEPEDDFVDTDPVTSEDTETNTESDSAQ
ncbi:MULTISPECIES: twin-arginine translocase TatA/TatE family subunit [Halostella]|uniref:twin-arginine translocase TatA/TatE family subunit n=1 Tax=Halostella TaxID=1843185 RepID=UPI001081CC77|nr:MULTISPECIES: twin-arginine translocase TatA/TatE family subunit [Halostella]